MNPNQAPGPMAEDCVTSVRAGASFPLCFSFSLSLIMFACRTRGTGTRSDRVRPLWMFLCLGITSKLTRCYLVAAVRLPHARVVHPQRRHDGCLLHRCHTAHCAPRVLSTSRQGVRRLYCQSNGAEHGSERTKPSTATILHLFVPVGELEQGRHHAG